MAPAHRRANAPLFFVYKCTAILYKYAYIQWHTITQSRTRGIKLPLNVQSLFTVPRLSFRSPLKAGKIQGPGDSQFFFPLLDALPETIVHRTVSSNSCGDRPGGKH